MCSSTWANSRLRNDRSGGWVGGELLSRHRRETRLPRQRDRGSVVVDAHAAGRQAAQVAADAASDVERRAQVQPREVPPIGTLHIEDLLPTRGREPLEPGGIVGTLGGRHPVSCPREIDLG
jgi:hypothetical protein